MYLGQGKLATTTSVTLKDAYTQLASTELAVTISDVQTPGMQVSGTATIVGGNLRVTLLTNWNGDGQTLTVLHAQSLQGTFSTIRVDGYKATPIYTNGELRLQLSL